MKNSFAKKIISIVLASSMLASTPGNIIAQEDLTFLAQESTESGVFSAASSDTEFMDPATDGSMEAPAGMEDTAGSGSSSGDVFDSGETGGTDASSAAAETPAAEAPAVSETPSAPADTSSAAVPSSDTVQTQPAAAGTDPEVSAAAPAGTDSGAFASLPGMEDEIAVDSDPSEGFVEENLAERTLDVQVYPQRLYEQQNVPTQELKTANELWQWLFGRDPEPNRNPSQNALHVQIQGYLPEDVTASAGYILFDEEKNHPEGESYQETALASIDVTLTRADGSEYLPEAPLDIIISGQPIGHVISRTNSYFLVYAHDEYNAMESLIVDESEFTSDVTVFRGLPDNAQEAQNEYWTRVAGLLSYQTALDHERVTFTEDPEGLRTNRSKKRIRFTLNEGQHLRFIVSALDMKEEAPEESGLPDGTAGLFETEVQSEAIRIPDTEAQTEAAQEIETETEAAQTVETEIQTEAAQAVETEIQTEAAQAVETETQTEAASEAETAAQTEAAVEPETAAETEAAPETEAPVVVPESETETEVSAAETETESEAFLETEEETETEEAQSETEAETELTEEELLNRSLRVRTQDGALVSVSGLMPADVSAQVLSEDADIYSEDLEGQGVLALDISLNRETGEVNAPEAGAEAVKDEDSVDAQTAGADFADTGSTGDSDPSAQVEEESSSTVEADNSIAYQPQEPVRVIITDSSIGEAARENAELEVWHIADDGTSTKVENVRFVGNSAIFYADGFSVYVVVYTVDFHWGDYTYSIEGEDSILLSTLLEELGVTEITLDDVTQAAFSNPAYLEIRQTDNDWLLQSLAPFDTEETLTLTLQNGQNVEIRVTDEQGEEEQTGSDPASVLKREYLALDGSWAYWRVVVNPGDGGSDADSYLTLSDTFDDGVAGDARQSIDYSSIRVESTGSVTYDYSGSTGTFVVPYGISSTITYRTRITAQPGKTALFRGTAVLKDADGTEIARSTAGVTDDSVVIYPSPSDVEGLGDKYMLKLYVYADGEMQTGIQGAQFILLDANQRALEYKLGDNKGEPVTFTTGEDGRVNIELHEEAGDISIEKNTGYYLEMIQAVGGFQKDNTLYSFMITDDPAYSSGGFWKYYNGDTMKVRLHPASGGLSVSIRFSGSYTMSTEQQNAVTAILQKQNEKNEWVEVERHPYTDMENGAIKFETALYDDTLDYQNTYRVIEENQSPWDLPEDIVLDTTYYCLINSGSSDPYTEPQTFFVGNANDSVSVVIDNRYEEPQLTIVKMDKKTGEVLPGAEFSVYEIVNAETSGEAVKTYTTDADGELVIMGGEPFESEKLYGIKETKAPEHYLLPLEAEWHYFYFCNDEYLEPRILANLPEGATAVNLTKGGDRITIDNQKETIDIPVMKIWQGNSWPEGISEVVVGLYQSVAGEEATPVLDGDDQPRTVTLTKTSPYNNKAFIGLPSRDSENHTIKYSIKEERINGQDPLTAGYVQEYGTSSAGVYIVRNKPATTLTVSKEWYDLSGGKVTDGALLAEQSDVTLDIYRSTTKISDEIRAEGITNAEMTTFTGTLTKVRSDLSFGSGDGWSKTIKDLDLQDDLGHPYYYYVLETVPSFGNETYVADEENDIITIKNKVAPERVNLTVTKNLKDDPRTDSLNRDFEFTLKLAVDETHPVRSWQVYVDADHPDNNLITDKNGEVKFTLKPTNPEQSPTEGASIMLSLPTGVTASVTEKYDPEYKVSTEAKFGEEMISGDGRTFTYATTENKDVTLTYTNTLRVICKVVDDNGNQEPFESLSRALEHIRDHSSDFTSPWTIYMLEDYTIPSKDMVSIKDGESLTITTAPKTDSMFPFVPPTEEPDRDFAVITRGEAGDSMLKNAGTLTLEKLCLDGGNGNNITASGDGGLVNSTGTLNLNAYTTLRNSTAEGKGGAVYAEGTINIVDTVAITGNSASSASALYLRGTLNMTGGSITGNTGTSDGAVVVDYAGDKVNLSGNVVISGNTNTQNKAANLYIGVDSDNIVNVVTPGLAGEAQIGITAMEGHMLIGEQFAMAEYGQTANLNRFTNDVYGYRGKLKDGTSTNIVWDGLTLKINKVVDPVGANPNDRFTITLSSQSIMMSTYIINGTLDYTVTPASGNKPGRIVFRNVKAKDEYTVSPLPVGNYTITEAASNYSPSYSIAETGSTEDPAVIPAGTFTAENDSTITVTNARKLADVKLTKTLVDRLKAEGETQNFEFKIKLTEANGTVVAGFALADGITTNAGGEATFTMSPTDTVDAIQNFQAPVGAAMTVTETVNPNYRITASAKTRPTEGEGAAITDADVDNVNVFAFAVTEDGADIIFTNVRKMAEIELSKTLAGKVSKTEAFTFTLTLTNGTAPVANYIVYRDETNPENNITTDANGEATIPFTFGENDTEAMSIPLTIPEGTKLVVAETEVKKNVNGTEQPIYNTSYSVNGGAAATGTTATIAAVSDSDKSIAFTNTRKMQTITVTNTVAGYAGNVVPFSYTATVTDGGENQDDYDLNGFTDGVMTFELTTGQSQTLTVPYGATLTVAETFIVGYGTTVKRGSAAAVEALSDTFVVTADVNPLLFTNSQLIGLRIVNNTSSTLENVKITVGKNNIYLVNEDQTGQKRISSNKTATISVDAGKTAILEIQHDTSVTAEQNYTVSGTSPADGYYYTINNEPSFHEFADPAILRVYNAAAYEVKGKLRYSVADSTVTFTEQPLVSFDSNGGSWTTEMDGYHDRDGDRKVYQKAVDSGETVARPTPDPVYPTAEGIAFLGWTTDETFAKQAHTESEDISAKLYDFENTLVTAPFTLYAIWARDPNVRTVTVKNGLDTTLTVTVTLTNDDPPGANYTLYEDTTNPVNSIKTDENGTASFTLQKNETKNLKVPNGAKLVIFGSAGIAYSTDFTDDGSTAGSFTIDPVDTDGTVSFIGGIFKITDADGNLLYDANGRPAVYGNLRKTNNANPDEAFDAYEKTLYSNAAHTIPATPAAVKQLVDEYTIPNTTAIAFPNATMTLTTAGKSDTDFPYVGVRDRAAIYRSTAGANANCFTLASGNITLTEIILDGGSENGVKIAKTANGGLIYMNNASGVLNVTTGTTMRNCEFAAYDNANNSRGGAIYANNGTINVSAGLFANLRARRGGAINAEGSAVLSITGTNGSTRFENCSTDANNDTNYGADGGAICYIASVSLTIDGGTENGYAVDAEGTKTSLTNPGIVFVRCVAGSKVGDGGAIYANTSNSNPVTVKGCEFVECSCKLDDKNKNNSGFGGGAIAAKSVKSLTVSYCRFTDCDSMISGGAVMGYVKTDDAGVTVENCAFENSRCKAQGGGVAVYQDNNDATNSTTKLTIKHSTFTNCSSGTNNGSGGAVQCYLPCIEFTNSTFTDCWAGKEGGAVNNYFGNGYTAVWNNSAMKVENCNFIRCRAEDRYDPTALQHYGGGINTKVKTVTVTDSYFEDCVSTLKEGGALHIGGQGGGSKATITGSTFKNCTAKNGGGAVLSSHETLTIEDSYFYGCESSASNGGAVYHYRNSRGDSTQKNLTITGCTFGADPDDSDSLGCSAVNNGGAIWTRATTDVKLENLTIENATAGNYGGGVYLDTGVTKATITGGSIKNCQAVSGSAVYVGKAATFTGDLEVSGNTVSDVNSGAIQTVSAGKLYFEGNVLVKQNTCSADSTYNHDVLMQINGNTIINTSSVGLDSGASIGVYVSDPNSAYANRGLEGQAFGTYGSSNYLDAFFNNRNGELYGCQMSADDTKIYWGNYVCKITDADGNTLTRPNGRDAVYQRLSQALDEFTLVTGGSAVYIKMLIEDYTIRQTAAISNFPNANITLTTAATSDAEHPYRGTEGTVCTISRTSGTEQLFKLNNADAVFQLEGITLDGRNDKSTETGNRRLIEAAQGALVINGGTTLQYGAASNGGAIDAAAAAQVTVNGVYDSASKEPTVRFINCTGTGNNKPNGGAIRAYNLNITNSSEETGEFGTAFINCSAYNGGAITSLGSSMEINGVFFDACQTQSAGGAVYHNYSDANSTSTFKNCAFENCVTNGNTTLAHGGAIEARTAELSVEDCSFKNCSATSDGGAVYHGYVDGNNKPSGNREKTTIKNTTFDGCSTTGSDTAYNYGGSVYTQAKTVEVIDSSFKDSTSANHGGALYCQSNVSGSVTTVSGSTFENCSVTRSVGRGGAICSRNKTLNITDSEKQATDISNCYVSANNRNGVSGAVHMDTDDNGNNSNLTLNISGSTRISGCYANEGGAIYLKSGVTMNLTGSDTDGPEFTQNGYATLNGSNVNATNGACIYLAEGGKLNLSGNLKFSRNNLPYEARITNGGNLDFVRQDIYLAGYSGKSAESIVVTGDLTGDTIWVWPVEAPHKQANDQFAKIALANGVTLSEDEMADTLLHFRNALADGNTGCTDGEFLAGVKLGNDKDNVYWDKMHTISFMKKDNKGVAVPGAEFTLYKDSNCREAVATMSSADGVNDKNAKGALLGKGAVEFASVRIGAYYMKETKTPISFKENDTTYLVLVGTPYLSPNENNRDLWQGDGPLNVHGAETLVARQTTNEGKFYGIFPLNENNKADLRANLASNSVGIVNIRNDYPNSFMKVDGNGDPLPGAAFKIYTAITGEDGKPQTFDDGYPKLKLWSRDGENYPAPVLSADGTSTFKDVDNNTLPKGMVYFRELPLGTYYLLETEYPERNGDGRLAFYAETDRVFKLDIEEDEKAEADGQIKVTLSEWKPNVEDNSSTEDDSSVEAKPPIYEELTKNDEDRFYTVSNQEVVCKLTDAEDNLLYVKGHSVWERDSVGNGTVRLFPAVYPTLEEGFAAAQNGIFVDKDGEPVSEDELKQSGLKLKVLKDFTIKEPIIYNSERPITFTTAEKQPTVDDRYVFSTTRTSDTSRAEIRRDYSEDADSESNGTEALITIAKDASTQGEGAQGASFTMQNIKLNGQKASYTGRAIHVVDGSLTILNNVLLQNFKHEAAPVGNTEGGNSSADETSVRGGTILMENDTTLTIDGGKNRTAIFSDNEAGNTTDSAFGGALALSNGCTVEIQNVQFIGNKVTASDGQTGNGGAVSISGVNLTLTNAVFNSNTASANGGALYVDEGASVTLKGSTAISNSAVNGGSFYNAATLNVTGGTFNNNNAEYGAGIFNKSGSVTVSDGSFRNNKAEENGGVIYNEAKNANSLTISGGTFTGNTAGKGGVLYLASNSSATITGGTISGNSSTNGGAIDVANVDENGDADNSARLYFGGTPVIYNNFESGSSTQQKNVVLSVDSNEIIQTTAEGLRKGAKIGVYTPKEQIEGKDTMIYDEHGVASKPFGTFGSDANLNCFVNDWSVYQYGVSEGGDDVKIYWADPIARVSVDEGTTWTYFAWLINQEVDRSTQAPRGAFDYANEQTGDVIIELLKDAPKPETVERYALKETFEFTEGKNIELRTTQDEVFNPGTEKFTSVLWRGADYGSMLKSSTGSLSLENVILDGNKAHFSSSEDGGLIYVNGGSLTVHSGVELRNSLTGGSGGAVYLNGGSFTMEAGSTITGNSAANGAAVLLAEDAAFTMQGGSIVSNASVTENVSGAVGGAVTMTKDAAKVVFSGDPIVYGNFNSAGYQQNVVLQHDSNAMIHAKGLTHSGNSIIGIYVAGEEAGTLFTNHGKEGMNFGTYDSGDTDKLSVFINDRKVKLTGCISEDGSYVRWTAEGPTAVAVSKVWKEEGVAAAEEDVENLRVYFELKKVSGGAGGDTHGTSLPGEMVTSFETAWPTALAAEVIRNHDQSKEIPMTVSNGFFWVDELKAFYIIVKNSNVGSTHFVDHPTNSTEAVLNLLISQNNAVKFSGEFINYDLYNSTGQFDTKYFTWMNNDWWPTSEVNYGDVVLYDGTYYVVWNPNGSPLGGWKDGTTGSGNNWFSIQPGSAGGSSGSANLKIAYTTQKQAEEEEGSLADDGYTVSSVESSDASQHSAVTTDYTHTNKDGTTETWHLFSIDTSDEDWTKIITNLESNASYYVVERRITRIEDQKDEDGNVVTDEDGNPVKVEVDLPLSNYSISYAYSQDGGSAVITNDAVQSTGVEVGFRKIGSDGVYLPGAAFALYESYQDAEENNITKRVSVTGESGFVDETTNMVLAYSGASGGNNASAAAGQTTTAAAAAVNTDPTPNGAVKFKVSEGVYFMREVTTPTGYEQDDSIYLVLAGASNMTYAELSAEVKEYFTNSAWISASADGIPAASQRLIDAQNNANASAASIGEAGGEEPETPYPDKGYAIFRLQKTEGTGSIRVSITEGSDVTNNGLMNVKTASRKVILKKTDGAFTPLPGAVFTLYNVDWTKRDETADHLAAQSGASGVFYINTLPFGRYYLEETQAPTGYGNNTGKYFILDVTADGVVVTPNKQSGATTPFTRDQVISHDGTTKNKAILTVGGAGIASGGNGTGTNTGGGTGTDPGSGTQTQTKIITVQLSNSTDFGSNDSIAVTINSVSKTLNSGTNSVEFVVEGDSGFAVSYMPSPDIQVKAADGTSEPQQTVAGGQTVSVKGVISKSITVQIPDTSNMTDTDKVTVTVAGSSDGAVELTKTVSSHVFPISDGKQHAVTCVASEGISVTPASANLAGNKSVNLTVTRRADDGGNTDAGVTGSGSFVVHAAKSMYHAGDYVDLSLKAANGENWTLHEAKYNNMTVTFSDNKVAEITQNDGIYFKKAGTVTVTLTAGGDIYKSGILMFHQGETATITLSADSALPAASYSNLSFKNSWDGNKQYDITLANDSDVKVSSLTVTLKAIGNVSTIGGRVTGTVNSNTNTCTVTYTDSNGIAAGATVTVQMHITGTGEFSVAALT